MKIPFSIKFRPQIESGEYKVETKVGCPVRIVCWDMICELPILGLVLLNDEKAEEIAVGFTNEGTNLLGEPLYDKLFIVTPEEELSEFEIRLLDWLSDDTSGEIPMERMKEVVRNRAAELRSFVKEELENEAPSIIETQSFREGFKVGEAEALKDLPRWKKAERDVDTGTIDFAVFHKNDGGDHEDWFSVEATNRLYKDEYYLELSDLEKLPGFKED